MENRNNINYTLIIRNVFTYDKKKLTSRRYSRAPFSSLARTSYRNNESNGNETVLVSLFLFFFSEQLSNLCEYSEYSRNNSKIILVKSFRIKIFIVQIIFFNHLMFIQIWIIWIYTETKLRSLQS